MVRNFFLIPDWLKNYQRSDFKFDLIAGLTVGVMLIPQGMAYAMIAGLPPIYGLYASTLPAIVYAWFGTSRHLSVGPGALTALLTASGISMVAASGTQDYMVMVTLLALTVGMIQFMLGFSRLGFLINFLSGPVITGFTSAAAIIIGLSQLKYLLGIPLVKTQHLQEIIQDLIPKLSQIHIPTLIIGICAIALLWFIQKLPAWLPGALVVVILSILITWILRLDLQGIRILGYIPAGLPRPTFTGITLSSFLTLFPTAFAISLVGFMESTAVARAIQARHKSYTIKPDTELMALGLANIMSAFLKSLPVTGGMSRSTVNDDSGAKTGMSSMISAGLILLTLMLLTPVFYFLPNAILAAVIIIAVSRLIKWKEARKLWYLDRKDFWMMIATFLGTLFMGIGPGISIGVALSLAWIIFEASYPHHAELGRIPGTRYFRNLRRFSDLEILDGVLIFRFDAPLFFANIHRFREVMSEYKSNRADFIHTIVMDMESINNIDSSALDVFEEMVSDLQKQNIQLYLSEIKGPVRDKFFTSGLTQKLGPDAFFVTTEDALNKILGEVKDHTADVALQTNASRH